MWRREFLATSLSAAAALAGAPALAGRTNPQSRRFRLTYAPHFGMFRNLAGDDPLDQLRFMAEEGFAAVEDNRIKQKPKELQTRIRREMDRHDMTLGAFAATSDFANPTFASGRKALREKVLKDITESIEVAKRMRATWVTVVPGKRDHRRPGSQQTASAVDLLRRCADLCEPHGVVMLLEPLNPRGGHRKLFLQDVLQARMICRAVDSPSCKILFDIYHQQITDGKLIPNIDRAWDEIAYFQIGDSPGRKEPGTGTIDYRRVLNHIYKKGYRGVLGMDHGNSKPGPAGEQAVIEAYAKHDPPLKSKRGTFPRCRPPTSQSFSGGGVAGVVAERTPQLRSLWGLPSVDPSHPVAIV